jgi:hypothetical protein
VDVEAPRRDVLAELAGMHDVAEAGKHVEQLGGDEVHLAEVGLRGIDPDT